MSQPAPHPERSSGFGRALIAVYAIFALAATARSAVQLITRGGEAPLAYGLSAFSGVIYLVATVALARRGRLAYLISWLTITVELIGVLTIGIASLTHPELFARDTVWSRFGMGYLFIPLLLPIVGMWWLRRVGR
ncbi:hypothetical protein GGQ54_001451 [Naumannella cuiyingiana]|uniref:Integral membrane protein n=1 Tax=Naumannella cuiyingiana TaxID=1347891 RepID=A0A7Z0D8V3_9ACTN|nr:hypothetical protein [Naumannella cuiyingiana]